MSSASSERLELRLKLEQALYEYVSKEDALPSATTLMRKVSCRYIEARKFVLKKIRNGTYTVDQIKADGGKAVISETAPVEEEESKKKEESSATGNLLVDSVVAATKEAVEEERKKKEEATPSQEAEVGPVTVKDDAFDNVEVTEEIVAKKKEEEAKQAEPAYVTRKAIRKMSVEEQNRFFDAVDTMLIAKNGAGSSEFFRLASYHGYPRPIYCQHGRETFPGWHRIYLQQFELALQVADKENGNDGQISLPYWDWTVNPEEGLPKIIRERFAAWPDDLFPKDVTPAYPLKRDTDKNIGYKIKSWGTDRMAYDCLLATQHAAHASSGDEGFDYPCIEKPHNHLHVIVGGNGGPMGSVAWAAYDIAFWLHHNNIDRIYESYLAIEPDSAEEFENFQEQQSTDLFDLAFTPFKKPNGEYYYPRDTFHTKKIGYVFDELIKPPAQQLREAPTLVLFRQVKVSEFESKCYQIHVYIVGKGQEDEFKEPQVSGDIDVTADNYAGGDGVFGRGMECSNCMTRPPVDLTVDITATLRKLQISRYDAVVKVYIEETTDDTDALLALSDTPLPEPIITGPFFESSDESLDKDGAIGGPNNENEVTALQKFLQRFGYYDDDKKIDGDYGLATTQAVKDFQVAAGLKVDGIAGPITKNMIVNSKRCSNRDPFAQNNVKDEEIGKPFKKKEITYTIDVQPGYLSRIRVEEVIASAFGQWAEVTPLTFTLIDDGLPGNEEGADIALSWTTGKTEDNRLGFDGAGGILGHGGDGFVEFDIAERWVYGETDEEIKDLSVLSDPSTWYRGKPKVSLFYVALHEIGHSLGLDHSNEAKDVMNPYYTPQLRKLSDHDKWRIKQLYYPKK